MGEVVGTARSVATSSPSDRVTKTNSATTTLNARDAAALKKLRSELSSIVAQAYHNLAVIETQSDRPEASLAKFAAAAKWHPDFPGLDRNWGIVTFRANQFDKAIAPLSRHLKSHPDDALIRRMVGVSYYFTKNYKSAVETLKPIESNLSDDAELAYFYGISLVQLERHREAAIVFGRISDRNEKAAQAQFYAGQGFVLTGDFEKAVKRFQQAASLDPKMKEAHYNAGQTLIRLNRLDEAADEFREELRHSPSNAYARYHLAYTLLERKVDVDEAEKLLKEAIDAKYDYSDARYQLGKILIEKGAVDEGLEHLQTAAALDPRKDYIQYQLSIAYRKASRIEEADRALKLYRELKAENRSENAVPSGSRKNEPR